MAKMKRAVYQAKKLEAQIDSNINREMKRVAMAAPGAQPLDYLNDIDVPKGDIIEASMRKIREENDAAKSKTPSRDKLRKWEAQTLLQIQSANSGGVK